MSNGVITLGNNPRHQTNNIYTFTFSRNLEHTMKIIARNLARETTEEELRALFAEFGVVESCNLVLDKATGKSKGFGFVEMPLYEARTAIKRLNTKRIGGSVIRVKEAEETPK
ncbi:MAG: hypothetical protein NVS3B3_03100 [Aquirhabdus sp.]